MNQQDKRNKRAKEIAQALALIDRNWPFPAQAVKVLSLFTAEDGDVFSLLDSYPGRFAGYEQWHPLLRSVRNHPQFGRQLFDTWSLTK